MLDENSPGIYLNQFMFKIGCQGIQSLFSTAIDLLLDTQNSIRLDFNDGANLQQAANHQFCSNAPSAFV